MTVRHKCPVYYWSWLPRLTVWRRRGSLSINLYRLQSILKKIAQTGNERNVKPLKGENFASKALQNIFMNASTTDTICLDTGLWLLLWWNVLIINYSESDNDDLSIANVFARVKIEVKPYHDYLTLDWDVSLLMLSSIKFSILRTRTGLAYYKLVAWFTVWFCSSHLQDGDPARSDTGEFIS